MPSYTCDGWNTANGLRSGARATAGGGRSGQRVVAAARLRMRARVLLEEADALVDVLRVPVDGRHRDAGEVYPRRRRWSPPHACLVRAVGQSSPCECMSG